jgi:ATPase subunit of ABC transporter with duplicated ATPase domains
LYNGDYTHFAGAKIAERKRREKEIDNRAREIAHHQDFIDRFRAKASKARQAQSKLRLIEKKAGELQELPGSSRRYPTFRFKPRRPSGRDVLKISSIRKAFGDNEVLHGVDLLVHRGDRLAIMGPNGIGKSTLLKIIMGEIRADKGEVEWGYETHLGYFAQDHEEEFQGAKETTEQWLWNFCAGRDRGFVRGQMGLMLFTKDDGEKKVSALSGGEAARLIFSRIALEEPNVLILDEPTNHLDLESIEALVAELECFEGTLVFVSHDRWFVSRLATRVVEIKPDEVTDYPGTYEEYVHHSGDDHLDVDRVVLKARREKRKKIKKMDVSVVNSAKEIRRAESDRDLLTDHIASAEQRAADIDEILAAPGFYERAASDEIAVLGNERGELKEQIERGLDEWAKLESEIERLRDSTDGTD